MAQLLESLFDNLAGDNQRFTFETHGSSSPLAVASASCLCHALQPEPLDRAAPGWHYNRMPSTAANLPHSCFYSCAALILKRCTLQTSDGFSTHVGLPSSSRCQGPVAFPGNWRLTTRLSNQRTGPPNCEPAHEHRGLNPRRSFRRSTWPRTSLRGR